MIDVMDWFTKPQIFTQVRFLLISLDSNLEISYWYLSYDWSTGGWTISWQIFETSAGMPNGEQIGQGTTLIAHFR